MRLLKFISEYWLAAVGWLAMVELVNRFSLQSNVILMVAAVFVAVGILSALVVPKSG